MAAYDLLVVGGGVAGMAAALTAPRGARVAVIDKGESGAGSSPLAQGGMAAAVGPDDSPSLHARDTIAAGAGLCDEAVVEDLCAEGPDVVAWLQSLGCAFDRAPDGSLDLAREAGQSVARSVHAKDATGAEIVRALREAVRERADRLEGRARSLAMREGRCVGVHTDSGPLLARATLLATGGAGGLWAATTNAPGATGDGIAMAAAAGAELADLEMMQFHPTALDDGTAGRALMTEALRGAGAILVDEAGDRFVDELAPRHVVARAILERGRAFLDCRPVRDLAERFPTILAGARARGFDPAAAPVPVSPAAHYFIGGVASDAYGRTSIPGLFAAGECASTGMHGANRMAGNSLLEAVAAGRRSGAAASSEPEPAQPEPPLAGLGEPDPSIPALMWDGCGPLRDEAGLRTAATAIARLPRSPHHDLCRLIVASAISRRESRGVHFRSDGPDVRTDGSTRTMLRLDASAPAVIRLS